MLKKLTCFILSIVMAVSCVSVCFGVSAADDTMDKLYLLAKQFPNGKYWNHMGSDLNSPDSWTDVPCDNHKDCGYFPGDCSCNSFDNAIQCMGYAYKIAYEIVGVSARKFTKSTTLNASKLRVGDVIRFNGHSVCVTGVDGERISYTDNNFTGMCQIRWGQTNLSSLKNFSYVLHYEGNNRKNTDLDFYEDVKIEDIEPPQMEDVEIWKMSGSALNVRSSASTTASIVGVISPSANFYVYEKKVSDGYLWAKVKYNSVIGWAALNYSEYISGSYESPEFTEAKTEYDSYSVPLKWKAVSGADSYQLKIYDESKKCIATFSITNPERTVKFKEDGVYYARVFALNSICSSWKIGGEAINFSVTKKEAAVEVTEIKMKTSGKMTAGKTGTLVPEILPANATNKAVTWKSDNESIATVNSKGLITAKACGTVNISCTSADGKVSAVCKVTVNLGKVTKVSATQSDSAVKLTWNEVKGAAGYRVYRYDSATNKYTKLGTVSKLNGTISGLKAGTTYGYLVRAYAKLSDGTVIWAPYSVSDVFYTSTKPSAPTLKATAGTKKFSLSWNKVSGATGYEIWYSTSANGTYKKLTTVTGTSYSKSCTTGKTYYFKVRAYKTVNGQTVLGVASSAKGVKIK